MFSAQNQADLDYVSISQHVVCQWWLLKRFYTYSDTTSYPKALRFAYISTVKIRVEGPFIVTLSSALDMAEDTWTKMISCGGSGDGR